MTIFTFNELLDFKKENFANYTLFLKGKLRQKYGGSCICETNILPSDVDLIDREKIIYKDNLYLLTDIDIDKHYIYFNEIGNKEKVLQYLERIGEE